MSGLLSIYMRSQGSVANRLSLEEMAQFRREARELAAEVTDERVLARYHAADAFYPFWLVGSASVASEAELNAAEESALAALTAGERLGDTNVKSMALDALASLAQTKGDWKKCREYSGKRMEFQVKHRMVEK